MIAVIDYKMGNHGSIMNVLKKIGVQAIISADPKEIEKADKLILPGVGSFDSGMKNLNDLGLLTVLNEMVLQKGTPIMGICLGMQLFSRGSEEGTLPGLCWIDAQAVRFKFNNEQNSRLRIPHMGWNMVEVTQGSPLFHEMYPEPRFYFVHSYHLSCKDEKNILTRTFYGYSFISSVISGNVVGVQFHPEKSHKFGVKLMKNFVELF
jgi:glutamine amidotransferase